jgi:hypothetical protein
LPHLRRKCRPNKYGTRLLRRLHRSGYLHLHLVRTTTERGFDLLPNVSGRQFVGSKIVGVSQQCR